jgi:hypothetical protein
MGLGIAFTFLGIVALAAPMVWLMWWAADSVGGGRRRPVPLAATSAGTLVAAGARSGFDRPHPVDSRVSSPPSAITVCSLSDGSALESCQGPDQGGQCTRMRADGVVPCAGLVLSLPRPIRGSTDWHIPTGYRACLLGGYAVYRQPVAGH